MSFLSVVEQKILFRFTRAVAIGLIVLVCLGFLGFAGWTLLHQTPGPSREVPPQKLVASLKAAREAKPDRSPFAELDPSSVLDPFEGLTLPAAFRELLDAAPGNKAFLAKEVQDLTKKEQQAYVNNLAEVWMLAKKDGISIRDTTLAFNLERARLHREGEKAAVEAKASRDLFRWVAIVTVFLVAQFSLVLVLLAIERNTRLPQKG